MPSLSTIKRGFSLIQPQEYSARFIDWMLGTFSLPNKDVVSDDGKMSSGSKGNDQKALHIVSARCHSNGMIVGQMKTEEKSNEITAIPALLEQLMIKGCIVTIDAMGAQGKIVEQMVEENKGDYVINLKGNQGTLHKEVKIISLGPNNPGDWQRSRRSVPKNQCSRFSVPLSKGRDESKIEPIFIPRFLIAWAMRKRLEQTDRGWNG